MRFTASYQQLKLDNFFTNRDRDRKIKNDSSKKLRTELFISAIKRSITTIMRYEIVEIVLLTFILVENHVVQSVVAMH